MPDFDALRRDNGSFVGTAADFDAYLLWAHSQVCQECGRAAVNAKGQREVQWMTETLCMDCFRSCFTNGERNAMAEVKPITTQDFPNAQPTPSTPSPTPVPPTPAPTPSPGPTPTVPEESR